MDVAWLVGVVVAALLPPIAEALARRMNGHKAAELEEAVESEYEKGLVNRRLPFNWVMRARWEVRRRRVYRWIRRKLTGYKPPTPPSPPGLT